jgi:hypothetical protein
MILKFSQEPGRSGSAISSPVHNGLRILRKNRNLIWKDDLKGDLAAEMRVAFPIAYHNDHAA